MEICKIRELSAMLQINLRALIGGLAVAELVGKQYDQTQTRKVEKYIRLPDPTLKEPGRMKRHQVLGLSEESRVQAKLEGSPDIQNPRHAALGELRGGQIGPDARCRGGRPADPGPGAISSAQCRERRHELSYNRPAFRRGRSHAGALRQGPGGGPAPRCSI